ncbi:MAG: pantetheine-phosphate adenylyltransferase [Bdellovibrionales bacterium]|nr:pantetheine-phosphate adenylyltransferase [Bdellovibrionales bacterium]
MVKAIYPGSFDPITLGHLDIIRRIQPLFSELVVVVANSQRKQYLFSLEERVQLIQQNLGSLPNVRIDKCDGLIVDYAAAAGAQVIVRGLRAVSDFESEYAMSAMNRKLNSHVETMIVFTRPEYSFVASTMVKEVAHHGGDLSNLVPTNVISALAGRIQVKGR